MAREAWRQAVPFLRRHEWAPARPLVFRAFEAWPGQPAYAGAYAALAARLRDTSESLRALRRLAAMGGTLDLAGEDFAGIRDAPAVAAAGRQLAANAEPMAGSTLAARLDQPDFYPEGIAADPAGDAWYLGSIRHRKVTRVRRDGSAEDVVIEAQDGLCAVLGVRIDPVRSRLWVTTAALPQMAGYAPADSGRSGVVAFDLATGRLVARFILPPTPGGHLLGDLAIAPNGDVYATDSQDPVIWRIRNGGSEVQEFLRHPGFRSLQGPAVHPSGRTMYVADWSHGVFVVDLNTRRVRLLAAPAGTTTLGIDGLAWHEGALIGVQNGMTPARVVRLALDPAGARITEVTVLDRQPELAPEPTIGTMANGRFYYIANSQWEQYDEAGRLKPGARLEGPRILELRLP